MEEIKEVAETPKYILHTPKAPDIFTLASIIGKIGVNKFSSLLKKDEIQALAKDVSKKKSIDSEDISMITGIGVFTEIAQIILVSMDKCEDDLYKLLSSTSNLEIEEVKKDLVENPQKYAVWFFEAFNLFLTFYNDYKNYF